MQDPRENRLILLVDPPAPDRTYPELSSAFGAERAVHIGLDLLQNSYRLIKSFSGALPLLSYSRSPRHPDLTWLDPDDPGFLEARNPDPSARIAEAFRLAFTTGAKKALLLSPLSPGVRPEWLLHAFQNLTPRSVALGANQGGSLYLAGAAGESQQALCGLKALDAAAAADLSERAKKGKFSILQLPETFRIDSEESLRRWLEERDAAAPLFAKQPPVPAPAPRPREDKRHARRQGRPAAAAQHTAQQPAPPIDGDERPPL